MYVAEVIEKSRANLRWDKQCDDGCNHHQTHIQDAELSMCQPPFGARSKYPPKKMQGTIVAKWLYINSS